MQTAHLHGPPSIGEAAEGRLAKPWHSWGGRRMSAKMHQHETVFEKRQRTLKR
jgi:hypothetical protein